jgi:hypothetical protein
METYEFYFPWLHTVLFYYDYHNKIPHTGERNSRNLFSHGSRGLKSNIKLLEGLCSPEDLQDGCHIAGSSTHTFLSVFKSLVCLCVKTSFKGISKLDLVLSI